MSRSPSRSLSPNPAPLKRRRTSAGRTQHRQMSRSPSVILQSSDIDNESLFGDGEQSLEGVPDLEGGEPAQQQTEPPSLAPQPSSLPTFIDLTNDSSPPPSPSRSRAQLDTQARPAAIDRRAPPFPARPTRPPPEVIDILDSDDDDEQAPPNPQPAGAGYVPANIPDPPSPDLVITGYRALTQRPVLPAITNLTRSLPPPPLTRSNAQSFEHQLRRVGDQALPGPAQNFFERFAQRFGGHFTVGTVSRILPSFLGSQPGVPDNLDLEIYDPAEHDDMYDDVQMDYEAQGWAFNGVDDLRGGSRARDEDAYKAPPAVQKGFTRTFVEDEVLLCAGCEEELADGNEGEARSQVWVSKKCGHVSCKLCGSHKFETNECTGVLWQLCFAQRANQGRQPAAAQGSTQRQARDVPQAVQSRGVWCKTHRPSFGPVPDIPVKQRLPQMIDAMDGKRRQDLTALMVYTNLIASVLNTITFNDGSLMMDGLLFRFLTPCPFIEISLAFRRSPTCLSRMPSVVRSPGSARSSFTLCILSKRSPSHEACPS